MEFFRNLFEMLDVSEYQDKIVGGDFNLVMQLDIDRLNSCFNHHKVAAFIRSKCEEEYTEIWREGHPNLKRYSWYRGKGSLRLSDRLDCFLINKMLRTRMTDVGYKPGVCSNPSQVLLEIKERERSVEIELTTSE